MEVNNLHIFLLILLTGFICSCNLSNSNDVIDNREEVQGIYFTDETSPEPIYVFGNPPELTSIPIQRDSQNQNSSDVPENFFVPVPFPNPADGNQSVSLHVPVTTNVEGWIEEARWKDEDKKDVETPRRMKIVNQELQAGYHVFNPSIKVKCRGGDFEEGFYKIKFQAYDTTLSVDIYLFEYVENMPDSMQSVRTFSGCD